MKEEVKKEILYDLNEAVRILKEREDKDIEELKKLSNHGIEDVALHKDLDLVSVSVLIYSLYKIVKQIPKEDYKDVVTELESAQKNLKQGNLGGYNRNIKVLFNIVKKSNAKIKEYLSDVMNAAKIKKSAELLKKGLSIGQAAGLMGLTNWDLQEYVGKTTTFEHHGEGINAKKRVMNALKIFGVNN